MSPALIMMILKLVEIFAPWIIQMAQNAVDSHVEPETLNKEKVLGKLAQQLRDEVDAEEPPEPHI